MGHAGTELGYWGFMPTEPAALGALLEAHGLAMAPATGIARPRRERWPPSVRSALLWWKP